MTELAPDEPKFEQVAAILRARIASGEYPPRTRVPSELKLVAEFGINSRTAAKALQALVEAGLTRRVRGMGSFVVPAEGDGAPEQG
ncbi:GntR family transcriptional regulator [Herbidospora mongoliensis]|uniref:GntR family transcriptional regulator n=1 Tax=Herbidospora mongoliensis TaxID=688067 RepID=UPI0008344F5E|nr:GntR family transcriptional regulator [Herbidospora mongoliensis]